MGLSVLEARRVGDLVRNLRMLAPRRMAPSLVGRDVLHIPLTDPNLPEFFTFVRGGTLPYFRIADDAGGERQVECTDANQPRIQMPDGKQSTAGLLIEETRVNPCLRSRSLDSAPWVSIGTPIVTPNNAVSPDGASTAETIEDDDGGAIERRVQTGMGLALSEHQFSVFAKHLAGAGGRLRTEDGTGGIITTDLATDGLWERVVHDDVVTNAAAAEIGLVPAAPGAAALGEYAFWGAMVEAGLFPTSFVPAGAVFATRQPERCEMLASAFAGLMTLLEGRVTIVWRPEFADGESGINRRLLEIGGTPNSSIRYSQGAKVIGLFSNNTQQVGTPALTFGRDTSVFVVHAWWRGTQCGFVVFQDGVLRVNGIGVWTPPTTQVSSSFFLGSSDTTAQQAAGVYHELIVG